MVKLLVRLGTLLALSVFGGSASAKSCMIFKEEEVVTLRGRIIQSATTEVEEGVPPHKYMAIMLEKPICWDKNPTDEKISFLEATPVSRKWLGHYVVLTGRMVAGDAWGIEVHQIRDASK